MMRRLIALAFALWLPNAQAAELVLEPFVADTMNELRTRYAGRPFMIAFWSVTCEPCREEMRDWKTLQRRYRGVPLILVGTDGPDAQAAAREFLQRESPRAERQFMFADRHTERLRYSIDPKWRGELPRTYFYDAQHRAAARSGRLDPAWVENWLRQQTGATAASQ